MKKVPAIFLNALPIIVMLLLIPMVKSDYWLTGLDIAVILVAFAARRERDDLIAFWFGFFIMILCEYIFVSMGVEKFARVSFLGVMPLWLPFLWAYGFVAIKRSLWILTGRR